MRVRGVGALLEFRLVELELMDMEDSQAGAKSGEGEF
jgi:hypothetical protein